MLSHADLLDLVKQRDNEIKILVTVYNKRDEELIVLQEAYENKCRELDAIVEQLKAKETSPNGTNEKP